MTDNKPKLKKTPIGPVGIILIVLAILAVCGIIVFVILSTKPCPNGQIRQKIGNLSICADICGKNAYGAQMYHYPVPGGKRGDITECRECQPGYTLRYEIPGDTSSTSECVKDCPSGTKRCPPIADYSKSKVEGLNNNLNLEDPEDTVKCIPETDACIWNNGNTYGCDVGQPCDEIIPGLGVYETCCGSDYVPVGLERCDPKTKKCVGCPPSQVICKIKNAGYTCCPSENCLPDESGNNICCDPKNIHPVDGQSICCPDSQYVAPPPASKLDPKPQAICCPDGYKADNLNSYCAEICGNIECKPGEMCVEIGNDLGNDYFKCIPTKCNLEINPNSRDDNKNVYDYAKTSGSCFLIDNITAAPEMEGILPEETYPMCQKLLGGKEKTEFDTFYLIGILGPDSHNINGIYKTDGYMTWKNSNGYTVTVDNFKTMTQKWNLKDSKDTVLYSASNIITKKDGTKHINIQPYPPRSGWTKKSKANSGNMFISYDFVPDVPYLYCGLNQENDDYADYGRVIEFDISPNSDQLKNIPKVDLDKMSEKMCQNFALNSEASKEGRFEYNSYTDVNGDITGSGKCAIFTKCTYHDTSKVQDLISTPCDGHPVTTLLNNASPTTWSPACNPGDKPIIVPNIDPKIYTTGDKDFANIFGSSAYKVGLKGTEGLTCVLDARQTSDIDVLKLQPAVYKDGTKCVGYIDEGTVGNSGINTCKYSPYSFINQPYFGLNNNNEPICVTSPADQGCSTSFKKSVSIPDDPGDPHWGCGGSSPPIYDQIGKYNPNLPYCRKRSDSNNPCITNNSITWAVCNTEIISGGEKPCGAGEITHNGICKTCDKVNPNNPNVFAYSFPSPSGQIELWNRVCGECSNPQTTYNNGKYTNMAATDTGHAKKIGNTTYGDCVCAEPAKGGSFDMKTDGRGCGNKNDGDILEETGGGRYKCEACTNNTTGKEPAPSAKSCQFLKEIEINKITGQFTNASNPDEETGFNNACIGDTSVSSLTYSDIPGITDEFNFIKDIKKVNPCTGGDLCSNKWREDSIQNEKIRKSSGCAVINLQLSGQGKKARNRNKLEGVCLEEGGDKNNVFKYRCANIGTVGNIETQTSRLLPNRTTVTTYANGKVWNPSSEVQSKGNFSNPTNDMQGNANGACVETDGDEANLYGWINTNIDGSYNNLELPYQLPSGLGSIGYDNSASNYGKTTAEGGTGNYMPIPVSEDGTKCCLDYGGNEYVKGQHQVSDPSKYISPDHTSNSNVDSGTPWANGGNACSGENDPSNPSTSVKLCAGCS